MNYGDGQTQGYSFDPMGNRTQKQDSLYGTEGYSYNAANMLLSRSGSSYTNDANGNTLTGGGRTSTWDSENRMVSCVNASNTSSFIYGTDGLRHRSVVNGTATDFVLDNSIFIRERRNSANIATYLVGARGPEYRRDDMNGQVRWYLYDGLGSVLGEVDPSGNVTSSRKFDVYGLVRGGVNPGGTSSHKFVGRLGHLSEDNTGLIYMRARYYDPYVGRFASRDVISSGVNRFAYCENNPTNKVDRSGHSTSLCGELDYDECVAHAGFGAHSVILGIIAGYAALQQLAIYGVFANLTDSLSKVASKLKRTVEQIEKAIEALKQDNSISGAQNNPDVLIDPETGDVYPKLPNGKPAEDSWGDIKDYL